MRFLALMTLFLIMVALLFILFHYNFTGHIGIVSCPFEEVVSWVECHGYFPGEVIVVMVVGCLCDVFSVDIV